MAIRVEEWTQRRWLRPEVDLYASEGDYWALSNLAPARDGRALRRLPAWSSQVRTDTGGLTGVRGAFYDADQARIVLLGANGSGDLAAAYLDSAWSLSSVTTLHATPSNLGGASLRDAAWFGGALYLVGSNGKVYSGSAYTGALALYNANVTYRLLAPIDERLYAVHTTGKVETTNSDNSAFVVYTTPKNDLGTPHFFAGYRGYGLLIVQDAQGLLRFVRVPLDTTTRYLQEIGLLHEHGHLPAYGSLFCQHDDQVYLSPGYYTTLGGEIGLNVYRFNGTRAEHVCEVRHAPNAGGSGYPAAAGLLSWRGELLYYALEGTTQTFKLLRGERLTDFPSLSATASAQPFAAVLGGRLIATADDTTEGVHYLQEGAAEDASLVTARLDMGHPGRLKRLARIAVLLSDAAASFGCKIEYRTNDTAAWTDAGTSVNTRRALADNLSDEFYTLQLCITLDDDSGSSQDIGIEAVSVIYSVDS